MAQKVPKDGISERAKLSMGLIDWVPGLYSNAPYQNLALILFCLLLVLLAISILGAPGF